MGNQKLTQDAASYSQPLAREYLVQEWGALALEAPGLGARALRASWPAEDVKALSKACAELKEFVRGFRKRVSSIPSLKQVIDGRADEASPIAGHKAGEVRKFLDDIERSLLQHSQELPEYWWRVPQENILAPGVPADILPSVNRLAVEAQRIELTAERIEKDAAVTPSPHLQLLDWAAANELPLSGGTALIWAIAVGVSPPRKRKQPLPGLKGTARRALSAASETRAKLGPLSPGELLVLKTPMRENWLRLHKLIQAGCVSSGHWEKEALLATFPELQGVQNG